MLMISFLNEAEEIDWQQDSIQSFFQEFIFRHKINMGQLMNPLRLLIIGNNQGPAMIEIATILGKREFFKRIETGLVKLPH